MGSEPTESTEQAVAEAAAEAKSRAVHQGSAWRPETIDFSGFVLSLAQAAMIDLGVAPHPERGRVGPDLQAAAQSIDILAILKDKTAGNLNADETRLLDGTLYQLRMSFCEAKHPKKG